MTSPVGNGGLVLDIREARARRLRHSSRDELHAAGSLATAACTCRVTGRCPTCRDWDARWAQDDARRRQLGQGGP